MLIYIFHFIRKTVECRTCGNERKTVQTMYKNKKTKYLVFVTEQLRSSLFNFAVVSTPQMFINVPVMKCSVQILQIQIQPDSGTFFLVIKMIMKIESTYSSFPKICRSSSEVAGPL